MTPAHHDDASAIRGVLDPPTSHLRWGDSREQISINQGGLFVSAYFLVIFFFLFLSLAKLPGHVHRQSSASFCASSSCTLQSKSQVMGCRAWRGGYPASGCRSITLAALGENHSRIRTCRCLSARDDLKLYLGPSMSTLCGKEVLSFIYSHQKTCLVDTFQNMSSLTPLPRPKESNASGI